MKPVHAAACLALVVVATVSVVAAPARPAEAAQVEWSPAYVADRPVDDMLTVPIVPLVTTPVPAPAAPARALTVARGAPAAALPATGAVTVRASYYGPGFYGRRTACGLTMTTELQGVAHRTLPCGTAVTLRYGGATVTVPVVDRGPYNYSREFDLTYATKLALGCPDLCTLTWIR